MSEKVHKIVSNFDAFELNVEKDSSKKKKKPIYEFEKLTEDINIDLKAAYSLTLCSFNYSEFLNSEYLSQRYSEGKR